MSGRIDPCPGVLAAALRVLTLGAVLGAAAAGGEVLATGGSAETPRRGGTLVVAIDDDPRALMPYAPPHAQATYLLTCMFTMLGGTAPDLLTTQPELARSWDWSPDRKTLTMHLRDDVVWSDGVPVTAEDVRFSFDVGRDSLVNWTSRSWKTAIAGCDVVDVHTVRFHYDRVFPDQLRYATQGWILPHHLLQGVPRDRWAESEFGRRPVGCGPFVLDSWEPQQRIVLRRNEHYHGKPEPYLDRIVFQIVPDAGTRLAQLGAGQLDLVEDVPARQAEELQKHPGGPVRLVSCRGRTYDFIGYDLRDPLFQSVEVREALTRAIDRDAIIAGLLHGFGERFESPIVPVVWAYDPPTPITPYDPEGARRLLAAAGWRDTDGDGWLDRDGRRFEFTVTLAADNELRRDAVVAVQSYWKAVGVKAEVRTLERVTALEMRAVGKCQAYFGGWQATVTANLQPVWGCSATRKLNFIGYCNPRVDSLNAAALLSPLEAARPLFREAQRLVVRDHPYTWMYYVHTAVGTSARFRGAVIDARGVFNNPEEWWVVGDR